MLYFDGLSISKLKEELQGALIKRKVTRIVQYSPQSLSIFFGKVNFYLTSSNNNSLCYVSDRKEVPPVKQLQFSLGLKKYLGGAILNSIEQDELDRTLIFSFSKLNELGERKNFNLIFEMIGKHSNIILTDDNYIILDQQKKFFLSENHSRLLMTGAKFEFLSSETISRLNPLDHQDELINLPSEKILEKFQGLGKLTSLTLGNKTEVNEFLSKVTPKVYLSNEKILYGSVLDLESYLASIYPDLKTISFPSISEMINYYVDTTQSSEQLRNLRQLLSKRISKEVKRQRKTLKAIDKDYSKYSNFEEFKLKGDILAANLFLLKGGESKIKLFNFYTNEDITLPLDPSKSPVENLNLLYDKYNKFKRGIEYIKERTLILNNSISYLNTIEFTISNADNLETLLGIKEELVKNKLLKVQKLKKEKKGQNKILPPTLTINDTLLFYGRNNIENDYVTFTLGGKQDIWFHIKDLPGCHLIYKGYISDFEIDPSILDKIGEIIGKNSKASIGDTIQIDYCERRYVKKIHGKQLGLVTYSKEKHFLYKIK